MSEAPTAKPVTLRTRLKALRGWHGRLSLRIKGVLSLAAVVGYAILMTIMVTEERLKLPSIVQDLERMHRLEEQMVQVNMQVARAITATGEAYFADNGENMTKPVFVELTPLDVALSTLVRHYTPLRQYQEQLGRSARNLAHNPSKAALADMRAILHKLVLELDQITIRLRGEKQKLLNSYQLVHDKVTLETLFFLFLGVVLVGAVMTIFFTRLTWDIRRVGVRAMAIVKGYRGRPLEVTRGDEIGGLMRAINQMQSELRERERQLELSRQQQFHHEKMAAVGSLAAAVAHEINNPIMAITGLAQVLSDERTDGSSGDGNGAESIPDMIIEQAKRIAAITRQISEFSTPQSPEPQLIDLNVIVRNTTSFVRFDKRFRRIDLQLDTDSQLNAVVAVADHVTQVLINLLINAADALENIERQKPQVTIRTRQTQQGAEIRVEDNGGGMAPEVIAHACDEFFTTKPRGKGSGLGLFLCKNLVEQNGGTLRIESVLNAGTKVILNFPLSPNTES